MMRDGLNDNAPFVSLTISPSKTADVELPDWRVKMLVRFAANERIDTSAISFSLSEPAVTWGRLTGYVWLRMQRNGNFFKGFISYDRKKWKPIFGIVLPLNKSLLTGLSISSGMANPTTVFFDNVSIDRKK